jgi:hypothetical protein
MAILLLIVGVIFLIVAGIKNEIEDEPVIKLSTSLMFLYGFVCIMFGGFLQILLWFL